MRTTVCLTALALAAAVLPVSPVAASAAGTWTVSPGGPVSTPIGRVVLWDTTSHGQFPCSGGTGLTGTLKSGTGLPGAGIGTVTSLDFGSCNGFPLSSGTVAWPLTAESYRAANKETSAKIGDIHFAVAGSGCSFVVDGTSGTAGNGVVKVKYYPLTRIRRFQLHFVSGGSTLHVYDRSGPSCGPLIHDGDAVFLTGVYSVSPDQAISSP